MGLIYYMYYMTAKLLPFVLAAKSAPARHAMSEGDMVLYRSEGQLIPARLVAPAGGGCWLARDARHTGSLIYLEPESITARLPRQELLDEAA